MACLVGKSIGTGRANCRWQAVDCTWHTVGGTSADYPHGTETSRLAAPGQRAVVTVAMSGGGKGQSATRRGCGAAAIRGKVGGAAVHLHVLRGRLLSGESPQWLFAEP